MPAVNRRRWSTLRTPLGRLQPATWIVLALLLAAAVSLVARVARRPGAAHDTLQVQVVNGSGIPELAQHAAARLRARGLDVVSIGNADAGTYTGTLVLLRRGRLPVARQVAAALGTGQVLEQRDATLLVDVTVVLGRDYATAGR
jgi:hypothetical protein